MYTLPELLRFKIVLFLVDALMNNATNLFLRVTFKNCFLILNTSTTKSLVGNINWSLIHICCIFLSYVVSAARLRTVRDIPNWKDLFQAALTVKFVKNNTVLFAQNLGIMGHAYCQKKMKILLNLQRKNYLKLAQSVEKLLKKFLDAIILFALAVLSFFIFVKKNIDTNANVRACLLESIEP